jgi:hypothetical protein
MLERLFGSAVVAAVAAVPLAALGCGRVGYDLTASQPLDSQPDAARGAFHGPVDGSPPSSMPDGRGATGRTDAGGGAMPGPEPCSEVVATVPDQCTEVPFLPVDPFIDGLPECGLPIYALDPEGWNADGAAPDAVAAYGVAWRPDGVYVFVRVTDPTAVPPDATAPASNGDGVELYVDTDGTFVAPPAYDEPGTRRFVVAAPRDAEASEARGEVWSGATEVSTAWTSTRFRVFPRSFGYVVEAFIVAGDLGVARLDLAAGKKVGIDLSVNVSFASPATAGPFGHRQGQYFLKGGASSPEMDVRAFCVPTLLGQ